MLLAFVFMGGGVTLLYAGYRQEWVTQRCRRRLGTGRTRRRPGGGASKVKMIPRVEKRVVASMFATAGASPSWLAYQHDLKLQVLAVRCALALVEAEVFERLLERLIFVPHAHPSRPAVFINLDRRDHPSRVLV